MTSRKATARATTARARGAQKATAPRSAAQAEVEGGGTIPLVIKGVTYHVVRDPDEWPVEALEYLLADQAIPFLAAVLGADQWAQVKANGLTVGEAKRVALGQLIGLYGSRLGE